MFTSPTGRSTDPAVCRREFDVVAKKAGLDGWTPVAGASGSVEEREPGITGVAEIACSSRERRRCRCRQQVSRSKRESERLVFIVCQVLDHENVSQRQHGSPRQLVRRQIAGQQRGALGCITLIWSGIAQR